MKWLWYLPFSFISLRLFYIAPKGEYPMAHALYGLGALIIGLFWIVYSFRKTSYNKIIDKFMIFNILLYHIVIICFYMTAQYHRITTYSPIELMLYWGETISITASRGINYYVNFLEIIFVPVILILNHYFIQRIIKFSNLKNSEIDNEHVFLGIIKPKNYMSIVYSFFKLTPISGFFIYSNNSVYAFRKSCGNIQQFSLSKIKSPFWLINTGVKVKDRTVALENMVGEKWSLFNNCLIVFSRVLGRNVFDIIGERDISNGKG